KETALQAERTALTAKDKALKAEQTANAQAQALLKQAHKAVRTIRDFDEILERYPDSKQVRTDMLELARDYYAELVAQVPSDVDARGELGATYVRLAGLHRLYKSFDRALDAADKGEQILQKL